jgi:nucleoside-diphosphate-sugar epimerase
VKRLLLTGASGFIGREVLSSARQVGYEVHAVRHLRSGNGVNDDVTWHQANLRDRTDFEALIARVRPTHVLHAAWVTEHGAYWTSPDNLDWLAAGAHLVRSFAQSGGKRFVAVGTCAEYAWDCNGHLVENRSENPGTFYGRIKLAHHDMLMAAAAQFGFSAATGRIFFLFGPGEAPDRVVAHACRSLATGRPATFSSGLQRRDFLHVADAGRGLVALLDSALGGAVNVSSGEARALRDVIEIVGDIAGRRDLIHFDPAAGRLGDPPLILGDNTRLISTGWRPSFSLAEGLANAYEYWRRELGQPA